MEASVPRRDDASDTPVFPDEALVDVLERIQEPAAICLSGGRIAAVNRAAARLSDLPVTGMTIGEILNRYEGYRADGSHLIRGDLPHARALRGEVVAQGERVDMTLPDGSIDRALVTSTPVIVDGRVVAALSSGTTSTPYVRRLAGDRVPRDADGPAEGR